MRKNSASKVYNMIYKL